MTTRYTVRSRLAAIAMAFVCFGVRQVLAQGNVTLQSTNVIAFAGSNATFTALPSGLPGDIFTNYVWHTAPGVQGPFSVIPGATNATYAISPVETTNAGFYFVSLADISGGNVYLLVSQLASLTVVDQAQVVTQPQPLLLPVGTNASFFVTASGTPPLGYIWREGGNPLHDGGRFSGSGTSNLVISDVQTTDTGNIDVIVTNSYSSATSQVAALTVLVPPGISSPPASVAGLANNNITVTITPVGSPQLFFQWYEGAIALTDGSHFSGTQTSALTIINAQTTDSGAYTVVITNAVGTFTSQPINVIVDIPPTITSTNAAKGKEGTSFNYTITATGSTPFTFGATGLPNGLQVNPSSGVISGVPAAFGIFNVTLSARNAGASTTAPLALTLTTDVPGITNALTAKGKQGTNFTFTVAASNNPTAFSATGLPPGLNFNAGSGVISGVPIVSGSFPIAIGASNIYGADSKTLTLALATAVPVITSATFAVGDQGTLPEFNYQITATNSPTVFGAIGLPLGLFINTNTGVISGIPMYGGTNNVTITAANAWGLGSTNLQIEVFFQIFDQLILTNLTYAYSSPYLLDFSFSLYNEVGDAVVPPAAQIHVAAFEGTNQVGEETSVILTRGSDKQLLSYLVLDYTFSMLVDSGFANEQYAAESFINESPVNAQFGIVEFHSQDFAPSVVSQFATSKSTLIGDIEGIQTNYVRGNYAGSRVWDALNQALNEFDPNTNTDQQRYVVLLTDGYDDSSQLYDTQPDPVDYLAGLAQTLNVSIYVVGYGSNVNVGDLQTLVTNTAGQFYLASTSPDLPAAFARIVKDIGGQYLLRWATLQRDPIPFTPSFFITAAGTASAAAWAGTETINVTNIDDSQTPPATNVVQQTVQLAPDYNPPFYAGNDTVGALNLVADAVVGPQNITLSAFYVPRFVRAFHIHYVPNFPCTPILDHTNLSEILYGWSMTQTNDGAGGFWLTLTSSNISILTSSVPYAALGDLVTFHFTFPDLITAGNAFSLFAVDNTIYSSPTLFPNGQSFTLDTTGFVTHYPTAPLGTPVPWLLHYGLISPPYSNLAAVELSDPNGTGYALWQDYLAGLKPTDPNSTFKLSATSPKAGKPTVLTFNTVQGRIYRIDTATTLGQWTTLLDGIPGTGGTVSIPDNRNLSTVSSVYYRVAVY